MYKTLALSAVVVTLLLHGAPARAQPDLTAELTFAKRIEKYQPAETGTRFEPGKVYAWSLIKGGAGSFNIQHVWYKNDKEVWRHTVAVRGKKYPTWSFIIASAGSWKVEVMDEAGKTIASGDFTVARGTAK